jgi:hypothetical protein
MMKNEATLKNVKGLIQKTSDKKRGNPKNARGLFKRPLIKKAATQKNGNELIQMTSNEKRGNSEKSKWANSKYL